MAWFRFAAIVNNDTLTNRTPLNHILKVFYLFTWKDS